MYNTYLSNTNIKTLLNFFYGIKTIKPSDIPLLDFDVLLITVIDSQNLKRHIKGEEFYKSLKTRKVKFLYFQNARTYQYLSN